MKLFSRMSRLARRRTQKRSAIVSFERCEERFLLSVFTVQTTSDSNGNTLRAAITGADGTPGSSIVFSIPITDPGYNAATQTFTISPLTPLPPISAAVTTIEGQTESQNLGQTAFVAISGSQIIGAANGLNLAAGSTGSTISGLEVLNFDGPGILVQSATNTIGGTTLAAANVLGLDSAGVSIGGAAATGNLLVGNFIGTNSAAANLANTTGVVVGSANNIIGGSTAAAANVIGFNTSAGVSISGATATGNLVEGNYIGTNAAGTSLNDIVGVAIASANNTIGGSTSATANVIGFNSTAGVSITGAAATGNLVAANFIGTSPTNPSSPQGNAVGVMITNASNDTIGGPSSGYANFVGFNTATGGTGAGVSISGASSTGDLIIGNDIGTNATGIIMPNDAGVVINGSSSNTVGSTSSGGANIIAGNTGDAVNVNSGNFDAIRQNSIFSNGSGIVLNGGGNGGQVAPVLQTVTITSTQTLITGQLSSTTNATDYTIEFFSSGSSTPGANQAQVFLGSVLVVGNGGLLPFNATLPLTVPSGQTVIATVTPANNNTSEFSNFLTVYTGFVVTSALDNPNTPVAGSLRQVIDNVNANPPATGTTDAITFSIGSGPQVISLGAALPTINVPVTIDGSTQPGYSGTPLIEIDGDGLTGDGLTLGAASAASTINALDIVDFNGNGINVQSNNDVIKGDYIGTTFNGTNFVSGPGNLTGILINGSHNTIGGTASGSGNVIAFNTDNAVNIASGSGDAIRQNLIFSSGSPPIFVAAGANNNQPAPTNLSYTSVTGLTTIQGQITGTVGATDTLDFFASSTTGATPAAQFLGTMTVTLSTSPQSFAVTFNLGTALSGSQTVTATATGPDNSTSEFAVSAGLSDPYVVTTGADSGVGSLRQAIIDSNTVPGTPITFALPSPYVITLASALPTITVPVTINGTSLPVYDPTSPTNPLIVELNANGVAGNGLTLGAGSGGSTIEGLDIVGFLSGAGVSVGSNGNVIEEDYSGGILQPNSAPGATTPLFSSSPNSVGFAVSGTANTIGGTTTGAGNLIGFSTSAGVQIVGATASPNNLVVGNFIGTDSANDNLGNVAAIQIFNSSNNTIGGSGSGAGNTIGFNTSNGIAVLSGTGNTIRENTYTGTNGPLVPTEANDIGLGPNANNNQPAPSLISAALLGSELSVLYRENVTNTTVVLDFYKVNSTSNPAEREFLGTITQLVANPTSQYTATFTPLFPVGINDTIIATATVPVTGNTSVFSGRVTVITSLTVTNTADNGPGSLRAAINSANGNTGSTIAFNIPTSDSGYNPTTQTFTISLSSALPQISAPVTIDGTTESAFLGGQPAIIAINGGGISNGLNLASGPGGSDILGLEILDFSGAGILAQTANNTIGATTAGAGNILGSDTGAGISISGASATSNVVLGNFIGTDSAGDNLADGVGVFVGSGSNVIGGTVSGSANVIGFNSSAGVSILGASNVVEGNFIGTNSSNTALHWGNTLGVVITGASANNNTIGGIGAGNVIAFNNSDATHGAVTVDAGTGDAIQQNLIYDNQGTTLVETGINLQSNGNDNQVAPKITAVTSAAGTTTVTLDPSAFAPGTYSLDFFASAPGDMTGSTQIQAHIFLGTRTATIVSGEPPLIETFAATTLNSGQQVTATATTSPGGDTSTFAVPVSVASTFLVTTTQPGPGSLEQAIVGVNADGSNPNADTIDFQLPASGPGYNPLNGTWTISLSAPLTTITHPVVLDATSQPGFTGSPVIVLDGTGIASASGLVLGAKSDGSTIEGFDIIDFTGAGVAGIDVESGNNVVETNYLGVETDGLTPGPNTQGVLINGSNNTIGGTVSGTPNTIAFNTDAGVNVNSGNGNAIRQNLIYSATVPNPPGIILNTNTNANNNINQPAPMNLKVTSVPNLTTIQGTIGGMSLAAGIYTLEYFASNPSGTVGPAFQFLGSSTVTLATPGTQTQPFSAVLNIPQLASDQTVTATVTSPPDAAAPAANDTSEFATSVALTAGFAVTTTADSGIGSLRQAIQNANTTPGQQTITFAIPITDSGYDPATQTWTITLSAQGDGFGGPLPALNNEVFLLGQSQLSQLPPTPPPDHPVIQIDGENLDGESPPASGLVLNAGSDGSIVQDLDIRDFAGEGIDIQSSFNSVTDDVIGLNASAGVSISGATITGNVLAGNLIGTDAAGDNLANAAGVAINSGAANNTIGGAGAGNTIAFNTGDGVQVEGLSTTGNVISQNLIYGNGGLGIDLGLTATPPSPATPGNNGQLAPIDLAFTSVPKLTTIDGQIQSPTAGDSYTVEFFASSPDGTLGPAFLYLGSDVVVIPSAAPPGGTLGGFTASLTNVVPLQLSGQTVTATVTGPGGNTSEFATPVTQFSQF
jgi:trimeric autotransporter adhesin